MVPKRYTSEIRKKIGSLDINICNFLGKICHSIKTNFIFLVVLVTNFSPTVKLLPTIEKKPLHDFFVLLNIKL